MTLRCSQWCVNLCVEPLCSVVIRAGLAVCVCIAIWELHEILPPKLPTLAQPFIKVEYSSHHHGNIAPVHLRILRSETLWRVLMPKVMLFIYWAILMWVTDLSEFAMLRGGGSALAWVRQSKVEMLIYVCRGCDYPHKVQKHLMVLHWGHATPRKFGNLGPVWWHHPAFRAPYSQRWFGGCWVCQTYSATSMFWINWDSQQG